jgi:hypothetical protein
MRFVSAVFCCTVCFTLHADVLRVAELGVVADDDKPDAAAINEILAKAKPGSTVALPQGKLLIEEPIKVPSNILLCGTGRDQTLLVHVGEKPHVFIQMREAEDVEIADLALDGRNRRQATQGIVASKCNRIQVHHVAVRNFVDTGEFGPHGIKFSGTSNSVICDNLIENIAPEDEWGAGMRVSDNCSHNQILRNRIHNTGRGGIFTNGKSTDAIVRDNVISGSHGIAFAIEIHSGSVRTIVEDNVVDHGLSIVSPNCAVRRNVVVDLSDTWGSYGIEGGGGPDGVVTDNIIEYGQGQGISLSGSTHHMLWARNRFANCSQWGMQIQGHSEEKRIRCLYFYDNTFRRMLTGHPSARYPGHDGNAIRFNDHSEYIVFDHNRIADNGARAIQITSGKDVNHMWFLKNTFSRNRRGLMDPYPGTAIVWENNIVDGNGADAQPKTHGETGTPPTASFTIPATAKIGETVTFQNTSKKGSEPIDHVLWDFGAGVPSTETNPSFAYDRIGEYTVSLVVWDKSGRASLATNQTIRILP